jgi:CheY-like chemotaxis protein
VGLVIVAPSGVRGQEPEPPSQEKASPKAAAAGAPAAAAPSPAPPTAPPPAPLYTRDPTTPLELWDAADYLIRTGQAEQAVPYLNKFIQAKPDDATLIKLRDQYGARSLLRLQDHAATRPLVEPMTAMLAAATRRNATRPDRLARFIGDLTKSREEQDYALERLREAGPFAVPALAAELEKPSTSGEARAVIASAMGRLDLSAVPALITVLDSVSSRPRLAADAATALGRIGDTRAVPALTAVAAAPGTPAGARDEARSAIAAITGLPYEGQPLSPVRRLVGEARRYHTHAIRFPGDPVVLWVWDEAAQAPAPQTVSRSEAEGAIGLKLARAALAIDPADRAAQSVALSLALEKAAERVGFANFPANDPSNVFSAAVAAGPAVLGDVLRQAIADGKPDLAAITATALGKVTDASALAIDGHFHPLVEALSAPGRRTRFAAARALVALDPRRPFAGSSQVVPVLAQFVTAQGPPRAVVIDGNTNRGGQLCGHLKSLGYEPYLATTGPEGFKAAAGSADIELILVDIHMIAGDWRLHDTLSNLKADARTAGIPVHVVGPLTRETDLLSLNHRFPGVKLIVTPTSPELLDRQLAIAGRPSALTPQERTAYAREAAALLAQIASRPNSPLEPDLARIEPALTIALNTPGTELSASSAMGDVPVPNAQRGLADVLIDPSKPSPVRQNAAVQLARSVQRFGPLVAAAQEVKLLAAFDREPDPALRTALGAVIGALRPKAAPTGLRLRNLTPAPLPAEPAVAPSRVPVPAPETATSPPVSSIPAPASVPVPVPPPAEPASPAEPKL